MNNTTQNLNSLLINANRALQEKNYTLGKKLLEQIFSLNENIFEVNLNLGIINFQLGNLDSSIDFLLKSKKINNSVPQIYLNLGLVYNKKGQHDLAIQNFKKVLEIDPNNLLANYNLGSNYKEILEYSKAEIYLKKTLELNPNFENAYNNLFDLYDRSNKQSNYEKLLKGATNSKINKSLIKFYSGIFEYKKKDYNRTIKIFEKLELDKKYFVQNITRHLILAKCYDQISDFANAFKNFKLNNILVQQHYGHRIDENDFIKYLNQRLNFFENFKISKWKNYPIKSKFNPIFLIGFPRSGTTLLDSILRTNNAIEVLEEKPTIKKFLIYLEKKTNNDLSQLDDLSENFIQEMQNFYLNERLKFQNNKEIEVVVDKMPLNLIHIGEILRFFPEAKFLFALRHPYDSVLSCFMQQFTLNPAMKNFLSIERSAYLYDQVMQLWKIYEKTFSLNIHFIKYEETIKNFETSTKEIFKFLNLKWNSETKNFYNVAKNRTDISTPSYNQVTSPLYEKSINRWRNYKLEFKNAKKYLDKWVNEFKYEL